MKKTLLILAIVIVVVALGAGGWYYFGAKKVVWDGTYQMTGVMACEGNIPNLTSIPMDTTLLVVGNKIVDQSKTFDIDAGGKAKEIMSLPASAATNGVSTDLDADYQFYKQGDVYKFTGNGTVILSVTSAGKDYSSTCTGDVSGVRQ
jgi:hypothetical protein